MRYAILSIALHLAAGSLFGGTCSDPYLMIPGIAGELSGPCQGAMDFITAQVMANTLTIVKHLDKASPALMKACAGGSHFADATLTIPSQNHHYSFTSLMVSSYMVNGGGGQVSETVVLSFGKFESRGSGPAGSAASRMTPRELNVIGGGSPGPASITFTNGHGHERTADQWQLTVRGGGGARLSIQIGPPPPGMASTPMRPGAAPAAMMPAAPPPPPASTLNCVELKRGGAPFARFVFHGAVPARGGNLQTERIQLQVPPGPRCAWQPGL